MIPVVTGENGVAEIRLPETFDFESHRVFREALQQAVQSNPREVILNFGSVTYIDSAALGMLMLAHHEGKDKNIRMVISNLSHSHPEKVLTMVRFDQYFEIRK